MPSSRLVDPEPVLVDDTETLYLCLADLYKRQSRTAIAIDLEGVNLGRNGSVCIVQLYGNGSDIIWIVDITTLGRAAFEEEDHQNRNLRGLLEDESIKKVFYDVRNDSDALYTHFDIRLKGTFDLQLLELVTRHSEGYNTRFVFGLGKSMEKFRLATPEWKRVKEEGLRLFAPEHGGSYQVFERRPLDEKVLTYCAQDVALLLELEKKMILSLGRFSLAHKQFVQKESDARVALSQTSSYNPEGRSKAHANIIWAGTGL